MFKNQLQELAQRSCFNLPAYACVREGPDHAPRFKASVNFNGEIFDSPTYSTTLRQAEHAAAEAALNSLSARGPSKSLTARVLDETGVYKNLLQETAHRAGLKLPVYSTVRSGPGHVPVFTSTVEIADMSFSGEAAKTKKQAEKNAAIAAWSAFKRRPLLEHQFQENAAGANWSSRVIRRRDQPRGRMQKPFAQKRPWKFPDPLLTPTSETKHKHSSFLSILPPPLTHHRKTDLTPLKLTVQESTPPFLKPVALVERPDNKISEAIKKEPFRSNSSSSSSSSYFYGGKPAVNRQFGAENARNLQQSPLLKIPPTCHIQVGLVPKYQRIAPAVQIRSVIPVCAAPPVRPTPKQDAAASSSSSSSSSSAELASSLGKLKL